MLKTKFENETLLLLGRLEGKVDSLIQAQALFEQDLNAIRKRVRTLEQRQAYWGGMAALVGTMLGFFMSWSGQ